MTHRHRFRLLAGLVGLWLAASVHAQQNIVMASTTSTEQSGLFSHLLRYPVMYNDFVLVGPAADPAKVRGKDIVVALQKLAASHTAFISRGDKSGTHAAELRFWKMTQQESKGNGYKECGCGMGPALNMGASMGAYVLTDRGTWLSFKNRQDLQILVEGDQRLFNQYGVIAVDPKRHPHVKVELAQKFVDWVISAPGQASIAAYKVGGEQLFFPNASK